MWIKKLKKKKFQFILVALMLCFTSSIFAACISFVAETKKFTNDYTSCENCQRITAIADKKYDREYFEKCSRLMDETTGIYFCDVTVMPKSFYFDQEKIKSYHNTAYHIDTIDNFMHKLKMIEGNESTPLYKEIWITSVCADSYDIKIGDKINYGSSDGESFTVSGIVATPIEPSPYMGTVPYYISESSSALLEGEVMNGISFFSDTVSSSDDYKKLFPEEFTVEALSMIDSAGIKLSISYLADIFGGVGLLAAAIIFIVSLIIIKFIIMSSLAKEYREIGTYKALGFTESQITGFYLKCFVFSGITGVAAGSVLCVPIARYLCHIVLGQLGDFSLSLLSAVLIVGAAVLLVIMLYAGVLFALCKIHKITPVEAFSVGSISSKKKTGRSLIKNAYSPFCVAVNDIVKRKGANLIIFFVLTVSFYMSVLFSSVNYSLSRIGEKPEEWFAFPDYDALVMSDSITDDAKYLDTSDYVDRYVFSNTDICLSGMRIDSDYDVNNIYMMIYSDCSENSLNLPLVDGRHPQSDDEILMSYDLAKKLDVKCGEWFHMENENYSNDYLVTGLFSSMYDGGKNIIMDGEEYFRYDRPDKFLSAMVFLNNNKSYEGFEKEAVKKLPYSNISQTPPFLEGSVNSINSVSKPLTSMFVIIFSAFSVLNIINLLLINNIENRRQYGILKAMGFTNLYLCIKNILRIMILTVIASCTAVMIHILFSQKIFFGIIHVNGLIKNTPLVLTVTGLLFAAILVISVLFTLPMRKVAPTELMDE